MNKKEKRFLTGALMEFDTSNNNGLYCVSSMVLPVCYFISQLPRSFDVTQTCPCVGITVKDVSQPMVLPTAFIFNIEV